MSGDVSQQRCWEMSGFNVETVEYKNISFTVWDVGGQDKVTTRSGVRARRNDARDND